MSTILGSGTVLGSGTILVLGSGTVLILGSGTVLGTVPGFLVLVPFLGSILPVYLTLVLFLGTVLIPICTNLTYLIPKSSTQQNTIHDLEYSTNL